MPTFLSIIAHNVLALWLVIGLPTIILASLRIGDDYSERIHLVRLGFLLWLLVLTALLLIVLASRPG